jgi:hypothetical protein
MSPAERLALAARISQEIDAYCERAYNDGHRNHLGASIIGKECDMQLWATFRWFGSKPFSGRMLRLFNRGHREEARFLEWLRGSGWTVWEADPETGKQFRISGVEGHYGGSCDGVGQHPEHGTFVLEFKTKATGSGFNKLCENGVAKQHPEHFTQMSVYGQKLDIKQGLYLSINKNDDSIHCEIVELDYSLAERMEVRAKDIIYAKTPPKRISASPTFWLCKFCDFVEPCHMGARPDKNCRSCVSAEPVENGEWFCNNHKSNIPKDFLPQGCTEWQSII